MDQIKIENLEIFANHGVYPEENRLGQKFLVSCILYVDTRKAGKTDDLEASVNYGTISHLIKEKMEEKNYRLIEAVAEQLAEEILLFDEKIRKVMVEVKKPWAPVGLPLETVSVKIERCWNEAFIALGSNMGDKKKYIENAVEELKNEKLCRVLKVSKLIGTEPYGVTDQDEFLNGALKHCLPRMSFWSCYTELSRKPEESGSADGDREHWIWTSFSMGIRSLKRMIYVYHISICRTGNLCLDQCVRSHRINGIRF